MDFGANIKKNSCCQVGGHHLEIMKAMCALINLGGNHMLSLWYNYKKGKQDSKAYKVSSSVWEILRSLFKDM